MAEPAPATTTPRGAVAQPIGSPVIPIELLYPEPAPGTTEVRLRALDGVVAILQNGAFSEVCAEACVLFDALSVLLPDPLVLLAEDLGPLGPGSPLHRWIVRDALWCAQGIAVEARVPLRAVASRGDPRRWRRGTSVRIELEPEPPTPEQVSWLRSARKAEVEALRVAEVWVRAPSESSTEACEDAAIPAHDLDPNDDDLLAVGGAVGAAHAVLCAVSVDDAGVAADAVGIAAYLVAHAAAQPAAEAEAEAEADEAATAAWEEARGCPEECAADESEAEDMEEAGNDAYEEVYLEVHFRAFRDGMAARARAAEAEARRQAHLRFRVLGAIRHLLPELG